MSVSINKDLGFRRDGSNNHFYRKDFWSGEYRPVVFLLS